MVAEEGWRGLRVNGGVRVSGDGLMGWRVGGGYGGRECCGCVIGGGVEGVGGSYGGREGGGEGMAMEAVGV